MDKARTILRRFADFASTAPDEIHVVAVLWTIPGGSTFPQHLHGRDVLIISGTYAGSPERGSEILRPLREFDEPILDMSATIPYCTLQQLYDRFFRKGELLHYWKGLYIDRLNDDAIAAIVDGANFSGAGETTNGSFVRPLVITTNAWFRSNRRTTRRTWFRLNQNIAVVDGSPLPFDGR
jgi:hypothetical protein